jgi:hypothetical protein
VLQHLNCAIIHVSLMEINAFFPAKFDHGFVHLGQIMAGNLKRSNKTGLEMVKQDWIKEGKKTFHSSLLQFG